MEVPLSRAYFINAQTSRIVSHSIGFVGCLVVLFYELKHRRTLGTEKRMNQKWLLIWAMLTILSSTANQIFNVTYALPSTVINICPYTSHFTLFLWFSKLIFLGLFQIRRLQLLFKNDMVSNVKLLLLFKLLYFGALISSVSAISFLCVITVNNYHQYGCIWTYGDIGSVINLLWIFIYLCWDGSTLIIYIIKLSEYRRTIKVMMIVSEKETEETKATEILYNRIKSSLSKIILLTLVYEATTSIVAILSFIVQTTQNEYVVIVFYAVGSVDVFIVALLVYLMQKHNEKHYYSCLLLLDKLYLTFCCKQLARDANQQLHTNDIKKTVVTVQTNNSDAGLSAPSQSA